MRLLVVEDESEDGQLVGVGERRGARGDVAGTGDDALWMAAAAENDAIVLDVMLPGIDGIDVCRTLRRRLLAPILMLTARDAVERPGGGPRCRRRRLPDQAVRLR